MRIPTTVGVLASAALSCCIGQRLTIYPHALTPREAAARGCWSMPVQLKSGDSAVTIVLDSAAVIESLPVYRQAADRLVVQRVPGLLVRLPEVIGQKFAAFWYSLPDTNIVGIWLYGSDVGRVNVEGQVRGDSLVGQVTDYGIDTHYIRPDSQILRRVPCAAPSN